MSYYKTKCTKDYGTIVDQFRTSTFSTERRVRRNGTVRPQTLPLSVTTMWHLLSRS